MELLLQNLFLSVLNMSITASYVIIFVMIARLFLKKMPKVFSSSLWAVVLFRLICPVSFSAAFSFLKAFNPSSGKMEYFPSNIGMAGDPRIDTGISGINSIVQNSMPAAAPYASVNPMQIIIFILSVIWILGVLALVIYSVVSYLLLKQKVHTAMLLEGNIFECENISMPFVLGLINPKVYLPLGLSETEKNFILKHEQTHIRRFDYIIKPFAFLVLCVHWFNPLVWLSFVLMSRDMEMSCDEQVINELGSDIKKAYSTSLLSLAADRKMISGSPLAFGETGAKERINNILNYKRPAFWVIIAAVIAVAAIGIGLLANPNIENNKLAVTDAKVKDAEWERVSYYAPTAKQAMEVYTKALTESDYQTIISLSPAASYDQNGQEIWDTVKINSVKIISQDVRENRACYELDLDIKDGGNSAFETGVSPRWLWLVKGKPGWYVEGLMTSGPPDASWWIMKSIVTSADPGPEAKTAAVVVSVPNDGMVHIIKIVVTDSAGTRVALGPEQHNAGTFEQLVTYYNKGKIQVYIDDNLVAEKQVH